MLRIIPPERGKSKADKAVDLIGGTGELPRQMKKLRVFFS
jgi:hypothetical protein